MINGKRVIAIIPARGGSKSIPKKNIRNLGGKPLLAWSIEVAQLVGEVDRVIVSTDSKEIADVAKGYGGEVCKRPGKLAKDDSLVIDAIRDLVNILRREGETAEIIVVLEPTCPLRSKEDVRECVSLLADENCNYDSIATFCEAKVNPYRTWKIENSSPHLLFDGVNSWLPRQKLPRAFQLNGAVYAFYFDRMADNDVGLLFGRRGAVIMPKERSVDIDTEIDFHIANIIVDNNKQYEEESSNYRS